VPAIGWDVGVMDLAGSAGRFERWLARWDSIHYLRIATQGYRLGGMERAFFPLYPLITRGITFLTHLPVLWSGLLLSSLCFLGTCLLLNRWVLLDHGPEAANWSVLWLCIFPMTFFFAAFYSEGLFVFLGLASLYLARRGRFLLSGLAITLAGAARPVAFLLAIPFLIEFLVQKDFRLPRLVGIALGALVAPVGTLAFLSFLSRQAGSHSIITPLPALLSTEFQSWFTWPWLTLYDGLRAALFGKGIPPGWFLRALNIQDTTCALAALVASIWGLFRLRLSSAAFLLASVFFLYVNHGPAKDPFWSFPRELVAMAPIYPVLALWTLRLPAKLRWLLVGASILLLGFLTAWFATGRWVA
jgi:Gpi18-like mannosyltransferase